MKDASLSKRTSLAVALLAAQGLGARVVMFLSNWVLGALMTQEEFGVSAMVMTVATFAWTFVGFGMDDVIVQRGRSISFWESTAFRASLAIGCLTSLATLALAPALGWAFHEPRVIGPVLLLAAAFPLGALCTVPQAKLSARMDFGFITQWGMAELFVAQVLTIGLAWAGFGAYAFAAPVPATMAMRAIAFTLRARPAPSRPQTGKRRGLLLRKGATVAGTKFLGYLVSQADYIVLALLASTTAVGYYFFAFRLAAGPVRAIAVSLNAVLFPAMAAFRNDPPRQSAAAVRAATLLAWVVSPLCYLQMAICGPVLIAIFGQKWADSILIIQLLSVGLAVEGIMAVLRAYLSATGQFSTAFAYSLGNGIGFVIACLLGALFGSTTGLALAVSLYYLLTQPLFFAFLVDRTGRRLANIINIFISPTITAAIAFAIPWAVSEQGWLPAEPIAQIAIIALAGGAIYALAFRVFAGGTFSELLGLVRSLGPSRRMRSELAPEPPRQ